MKYNRKHIVLYCKTLGTHSKAACRGTEMSSDKVNETQQKPWSNCTWNHMLDFSLMSASKFLADSLGFLFVCFACLIDLLLSIKRILTIIELIHLPLIHQTVLKYSSVSGTGLCFLELQSRERGYTQSKPAEVINSIFVRLWACHRQLGHIILHEPPACFNF